MSPAAQDPEPEAFGGLLCCALRRGVTENNQRLARALSEWGGPRSEAQLLEALNLAAFGVTEPADLPPLLDDRPPWRRVAPASRLPFQRLEEAERGRWVGRVAQELHAWSSHPKAFLQRYAARADTAQGLIVSGDTLLYMLEACQENAPLALAATRELPLEGLMDLRVLALHLWDQAMDLGDPHPVLLMAGGQGSGKTTVARHLANLGWPGAIVDTPWVVEADIRAVRNRHRDAWIAFVDRPFEDAFTSMVHRAADEGRIVKPADIARNHALIPGELHRAASLFNNQPRVALWHLRNTTPAKALAPGGPLHREGKEALASLRNRKESRGYEALEQAAAQVWRTLQQEIRSGSQNPYPANLAQDIGRELVGLRDITV